jgi:hypothetical protein
VIAPVLLAALSAAAPPPVEDPAVFAVIIGNNASDGGELRDLRFADDDAARYYELFSLTGGRVELLSVLDADTQRLHPEVAAVARVPREDELSAVLDGVFEEIRQVRAAGRRTVFHFIYVGHGSVGRDGEGQMHLVGGRFSRSDLFQKVISRSPATVNHVIIDACNAYLMVARRGSEADVDAALEQFLAREDLAAFPNTGVLLSTSEAAEVHEWSRFSAGIFSHEVRSALAGGSDVDRDGRATYDEVRAFIAAANARIDNPRARLEVHAAPPRVDLRAPLFDRAWTRAQEVKIPAEMAGRYYLEDSRGVRYADFHSSPDLSLVFTLVPQDLYFLRGEDFELRLPTSVAKRVDASTLEPRPLTIAMRGSESETFQKYLFALPFGPSYFEGYRASLPGPNAVRAPVEPAPRRGLSGRQVAGIVVAGTGAASLIASLVVGLSVGALEAEYGEAVGSDDDIDDLEGQIDDRVLVTNVLLGAGIGLAVTGATLILWPDRR